VNPIPGRMKAAMRKKTSNATKSSPTKIKTIAAQAGVGGVYVSVHVMRESSVQRALHIYPPEGRINVQAVELLCKTAEAQTRKPLIVILLLLLNRHRFNVGTGIEDANKVAQGSPLPNPRSVRFESSAHVTRHP
jgi:hypothetical protein